MNSSSASSASLKRRLLDHHQTPMINHIRELRNRDVTTYLSIGHKLGAGASGEILDLLGRDFFESNTWLTSTAFDEALRRSEELAADAWGADRSFYLVDGSSSGNHAFLLATLSPGDEVIVSRDLHWSMLVALIITGARPVYVAPRLDTEHDIGVGIEAEDIERVLVLHPSARLVAIVSPSFCGIASDLEGICRVSHDRNVPVYVDEAWGAHYHFHGELPRSAMASSADAAVASVHKLLPAVSQGSVLHVQGNRVDRDRLETAVHMMQTTSPLLPILASLDAARKQMALDGEAAMTQVIGLSRQARERLNRIAGVRVLDHESVSVPEHRLDPTKLVIEVHGVGLTGFEFEQRLNRDFAIAIEASDHRGIIGNLNMGDTPASVDRLVRAFEQIAENSKGRTGNGRVQRASGTAVAIAEQAMTPREAFFSPSEAIQLHQAAGRIAAELVTPYPPGIPVLAPGEVITEEKVAFLTATYESGRGKYGGEASRLIRVVAE